MTTKDIRGSAETARKKRYIDTVKLDIRRQEREIFERQQAAERASSQRRFRFKQALEERLREVAEARTRPYYSTEWGN